MSIKLIIIIVCIILLIAIEIWKKVVIRGAASRISGNVDRAFQPDHTFRRVDAKNYPWLNLAFYDSARADIESAGFEWLADIEDETITEVYPNMRTFVRICLGPDRRTRAAIYEIAPGGPQGKVTRPSTKTCELISEISDGTTITTTTAPPGRLLDLPEGVVRNNLPAGTPLSRMLDAHKRVVDEYLERHYGESPEQIDTFEEATAAWQKGIDRQRNRLQASKGLTRKEFMRIGGPEKADVASEVFDQMEKLKKKDGQ